MDHRALRLARIILVVLAIGAVTAAEPLVYAQAPLPPAASGSLLDSGLPDPATVSGISTPLALEALALTLAASEGAAATATEGRRLAAAAAR